MEKTRPERIRQYFETIGHHLQRPETIYVAGAVALIMPGYVSRRTADVDVVGDIPEKLRNDHAFLSSLEESFMLQLGHVQTHYFPVGWRDRAHSMAAFGRLQVFLVDVYDVLLSKLFSARLKDQEDLRIVIPQLDKDILTRKLKETAQGFLVTERLRDLAQTNWRILFGEDLPS